MDRLVHRKAVSDFGFAFRPKNQSAPFSFYQSMIPKDVDGLPEKIMLQQTPCCARMKPSLIVMDGPVPAMQVFLARMREAARRRATGRPASPRMTKPAFQVENRSNALGTRSLEPRCVHSL
jgi:hypothetical protein